jgi:hypothetical protein
MYWFAIGLDPLLILLESKLKGIKICSIPKFGPEPQPMLALRPPPTAGARGGRARKGEKPKQVAVPPSQQPVVERLRTVSYADDVKCAVTSMEEIKMVIDACSMLERASGVKLHRGIDSGKVRLLPLGRWQTTLTQADMPHPFIRLSNSLDFLGVVLKGKTKLTMRENNKNMVDKVAKRVRPWRGGRHMTISYRGLTVNIYAYSTVAHMWCSMPVTMTSQKEMSKEVRKWLLQDSFIKPAVEALHRPRNEGGLGAFHVPTRVRASLLRTFCELACNPDFNHSPVLEAAWRVHVLKEFCAIDPAEINFPYYDESFYETLRTFNERTDVDVRTMKIGQWYKELLRLEVTHDAEGQLVPVRVERNRPNIDWVEAWERAATRGLPPEMTDFAFRLLHRMLPLQAEMARFKGANLEEGTPGHCNMCANNESETYEHAFFNCDPYRLAGRALLDITSIISDGLVTVEDALHLQLEGQGDSALAAATTVLSGLLLLWEKRKVKKPVSVLMMRAELEARAAILYNTLYSESAVEMTKALGLSLHR